jgi:hypothetical protein
MWAGGVQSFAYVYCPVGLDLFQIREIPRKRQENGLNFFFQATFQLAIDLLSGS